MVVLYSIVWLHLIYSISFLFIVVLVICSFHMAASVAEVSWQECGPWRSLACWSCLRSLPARRWAHGLSEMFPPAARPHHRRDKAQALHAKEVQKKVIGLQHTRPPEGAGRTFSGSLSHGLWSYRYGRVRNTRGMGQPLIVLWLWASHFAQAVAFPPHHRRRYHQSLWVWGLKHRC